jgi:hypothetical protein
MEVMRSSETSFLTRGIWCHIQEDSILHSQCCENLKLYTEKWVFKLKWWVEEWRLLGCGYCKNRRLHLPQLDNEPNSVAFLPFVGTIFNHISRVLARHNIKSVGLTHMKLSSLLSPVKDHLGISTPGVYRIPCECGRLYIGQTRRSVDIRLRGINGT